MGRELKRKQAKREGKNVKELQVKKQDFNTMKPKTLVIIVAVIYGVTPKANIENCFKPPPAIKLNSSRNPNSFVIAFAQGTVILVPIQKIERIAKVNKTRCLKSLFEGLNICEIVANI